MVNSIVLVGRLAGDPSGKVTQSGVAYTTFTVAIERSYAAEGKERETDFIDCRAWRQTAEFIAKYFRKGSWISVEGELQTNMYEAQDGSKRKAVYVQVRQAGFVGAKQDAQKPEATQQSGVPDGFIKDDDVPF